MKIAIYLIVAIAYAACTTDVPMSAKDFDSKTSYLNPNIAYDSFVDVRDNQQYKTVTIGSQVWMAENLNYSGDDGHGNKTYRIGWCQGVGGTDTTNHSDSSTCDLYGRFYNWAQALNLPEIYLEQTANPPAVGVCPSGWHMPSFTEWQTLSRYIRNQTNAEFWYEGAYLKAVTNEYGLWDNIENNHGDPFGFSAIPAGFRHPDGLWISPGTEAAFWSSTEKSANGADLAMLVYYDNSFYQQSYIKPLSHNIRCIEN